MRPVAAEDVLSLQLVEDPRISPDGRRVVFGVRRASLEKKKYFAHLFAVDAAGGEPVPLTSGDVADAQPRWSPDGSTIAFVRKVDDDAQVFLLDAAGGEPRPLTKLPKGRVGGLAWSPDGSRLAFTFRAKPPADVVVRHITSLRYREEGIGWLDERAHVHVADARTGETRRITDGPFDHGAPTWSPDGTRLAFAANRKPDGDYRILDADLWIVAGEGGELRRVATPPGPVENPVWSPDGKRIAYVGHDDPEASWGAKNDHVWVVPAERGPARDLTPDLDRPCHDATITDTRPFHSIAQPPVWSPDSSRIYFPVSDAGATNVCAVTLDLKRATVTAGPQVVQQFSGAGDALAAVIATAEDVGDLYLLRRGDRKRLTRINAEYFSSVAVAKPREFAVKAPDGTPVQSFVLLPPGHDGTTKVPMALEIHGGPRAQYGYVFFHEFQMLAAMGYAVVYSNPRGSQGFGEAFTKAIVADWGNVDYQDLMAVTDAAIAKFPIDPARMAAMGGSYGGYMTNWIVGHTDRFRCGITMRSVTNLASMAGTSDFAHEDFREFGAHPWEDFERHWRMSPLAYAAKIKTPLLIVHSEGDLRCPIEQAEQLYAYLKGQRKDVEFLRFPEENHDLSRGGRPDRRIERLRHFERFLRKHLG